MGEWFGKGCQHQVCQYERDCDGVEDKSQPELVYCNHKGNTDECEGNCNLKRCPLVNVQPAIPLSEQAIAYKIEELRKWLDSLEDPEELKYAQIVLDMDPDIKERLVKLLELWACSNTEPCKLKKNDTADACITKGCPDVHTCRPTDNAKQLTASGRARIGTICFTGHRPKDLWGYPWDDNKGHYVTLRQKLEGMILGAALHNDTRRIIVGMAQGVDRIALYAALRVRNQLRDQHDIKLEIVAAVPFIGQEKAWPDYDQKRYQGELKQCDTVVIVDQDRGYFVKPDGEPAILAARKLHARNRWMVDHSDGCIAVWSGKAKGGTASCIEYARKVGIPVNVVDPKSIAPLKF